MYNSKFEPIEIIKTLRDVDYPHMVMPDHVQHHPDLMSSSQGLAFAYGYIKALMLAASEG